MQAGKCLNYCIANLFRTICTKFCQNRMGFVEDMTKTFWCVFWFTVCISVAAHNASIIAIPVNSSHGQFITVNLSHSQLVTVNSSVQYRHYSDNNFNCISALASIVAHSLGVTGIQVQTKCNLMALYSISLPLLTSPTQKDLVIDVISFQKISLRAVVFLCCGRYAIMPGLN